MPDFHRDITRNHPMSPLIAVTGATGIIGGGIARRLAIAGIAQRLIVRSPGRTPSIPATEIARASYADLAAATAALTGIDTVLMVSAAEDPNRVADHRTFIDAAVAAGVQRIVYTSFYGAGPASTFLLARDHWHTEQHIRASPLNFTFLQDNLYADVLLDFAGPEGVLRGPAGDGRVAAVARSDVIDVAVVVLEAAAMAVTTAGEPGSTVHDGQSYRLTGPAALTLAEVAEVISRVTGRAIRYEAETIDEAYASRVGFGAPQWMIDGWISTYTAIAAGELADVTDDVLRIAGHPPLSLAELFGG
jgi:NAD(P)H dehydrogenase (quinone)